MNKKLKKLIEEKIIREQMSLDETIEYIWELKDINSSQSNAKAREERNE